MKKQICIPYIACFLISAFIISSCNSNNNTNGSAPVVCSLASEATLTGYKGPVKKIIEETFIPDSTIDDSKPFITTEIHFDTSGNITFHEIYTHNKDNLKNTIDYQYQNNYAVIINSSYEPAVEYALGQAALRSWKDENTYELITVSFDINMDSTISTVSLDENCMVKNVTETYSTGKYHNLAFHDDTIPKQVFINPKSPGNNETITKKDNYGNPLEKSSGKERHQYTYEYY